MGDYVASAISKTKTVTTGTRPILNQCRRFSQNAWKKDLCSNCFKSKEEHQKPDNGLVLRATAARVITTPDPHTKPKQSILKSITNGSSTARNDSSGPEKKENGTRLKVKFPVEESEIIGYGGDDEFDVSDNDDDDDDEEINIGEGSENHGPPEDNEDDINLQRITKSNTDFNSVTANLLPSDDNKNSNSTPTNIKNTHIPLMLGRLNTDNNKPKQTLLVSVKPFGSDLESNRSVKTKSIFNSKTNGFSDDINNQRSDDKITTTVDVNPIIENDDKSKDKITTDSIDKLENDKDLVNKEKNADSVIVDIVNDATNCAILKSVESETFKKKTLIDSNKSLKSNESDANNSQLKLLTGKVSVQSNLTNSDSNSNNNNTSEIKKSQITRGTIITKDHEQVKTKIFKTVTAASNTTTNTSGTVSKSIENKLTSLSSFLLNNVKKVDDNNAADNDGNDKKFILGSKNKTTDSNNFVGKNNITKLTQKINYKNNIINDDNIKCVSFKEYGTNDYLNVDHKSEPSVLTVDKDKTVDDDDNNGSDIDDDNSLPLLSRELAGEPDGRADSDDTNEPSSIPPSLPLTPPPVLNLHQTTQPARSPPSTPPPPPPVSPTVSNYETPPPVHHPPRSSFLHSFQSSNKTIVSTTEKPKLPVKPANILAELQSTIPQVKSVEEVIIQANSDENENGVDVHVNSDTGGTEETPQQQQQQQQQNATTVASATKRQAPKPPPPPVVSTITNGTTPGSFNRRCSINNDVEMKPQRERARVDRHTDTPSAGAIYTNIMMSNTVTEFVPKSVSHDCLSFGSVSSTTQSSVPPPTNKRGSKVRSTLRKLLRFGSRSEDDSLFDDIANNAISFNGTSNNSNNSNVNTTTSVTGAPVTRVRPEIIHPLDINKSGVQVLRNSTDIEQIYANANKMEELQMMRTHHPHQYHFINSGGRPSKPPPPPRSQSLDLTLGIGLVQRGGPPAPPPARPPPPSTPNISPLSTTSPALRSETGLYANLGDARLEVMPEKPQRSGSIRETTNPNLAGGSSSCSSYQIYETIRVVTTTNHQLAASSIIHSNTNPDSEMMKEDGWSSSRKKSRRTRRRSSCRDSHKTLEDAYGALVITNHQSLSLLLNQINLNDVELKSDLKWSNFTLDGSAEPIRIGCRLFYLTATYNEGEETTTGGSTAVTLCVSIRNCDDKSNNPIATASSSTPFFPPSASLIVAQFDDVIPKRYIHTGKTIPTDTDDKASVPVSVSVLLRHSLQINRLTEYSWISETPDSNDVNIECALVLYQLIQCLLHRQPSSATTGLIDKNDIVLLKRKRQIRSRRRSSSTRRKRQSDSSSDSNPDDINDHRDADDDDDDLDDDLTLSLCVLPPHQHSDKCESSEKEQKKNNNNEEEEWLLERVKSMALASHLKNLLIRIISQFADGTRTALSHLKGVLELWLWGPPPTVFTGIPKEREKSIQQWLDLERASVLQQAAILISSSSFDIYDYCRLAFLVQTDVKAIGETLKSFDDENHYRFVMNNS